MNRPNYSIHVHVTCFLQGYLDLASSEVTHFTTAVTGFSPSIEFKRAYGTGSSFLSFMCFVLWRSATFVSLNLGSFHLAEKYGPTDNFQLKILNYTSTILNLVAIASLASSRLEEFKFAIRVTRLH